MRRLIRRSDLPLEGFREQDDHELLEFVLVSGLDGHHGRHVTQLEFGQQMVERAQRRYEAAQARRRVVAAETRVSQQAPDLFQRLGERPGQRSHGAALGFPVHYARSRGQTLG